MKGYAILIDSQIRRNQKHKSKTKNRKSRRAVFFDEGIKALERWSNYPHKEMISRTHLSKKIKTAAKKAFPHNPEKWICVHDLRHSYAVRLIRDYEFNMTQVAQYIGDSVLVCEEYYASFVPSDETIDLLYQKKIQDKK